MTGLQRVLGLRDLVLLNVVAIISLRWWLTSSKVFGYAALSLWGLAALLFFLPSALAVIDLTTRYPEEGGLYVWTKRAFGEGHGFISGWCLWTNNLFYFPTLLLFIAGNLLFMAGEGYRHLESSPLFMAAFSLLLFWLCLWLNVRGLRYGRWLTNAGALGTWIPAALLILAAGYALARSGPATPFAAADLAPVFTLGTVAFFSQICFGFSGIELGSMLGGEIVDPRRNVPRAIAIAGLVITLIYVLGTAALLVTLPRDEIGFLSGVVYAIAAVQERAGVGYLAGACGVLIAVGGVGGVSAWLAGASRIPFVAGIDRYLPESFGRLHPRHASPHVALLVTGAISSLIILVGFAFASVEEAYAWMADFTIVIYFIPYLYLFAALIRISGRADRPAGAIPVPGGRPGAILVGATGFLTTGVAILLALFPPELSVNRWLWVGKLLGGAALVVGVGAALYWRASRRRPAGITTGGSPACGSGS